MNVPDLAIYNNNSVPAIHITQATLLFLRMYDLAVYNTNSVRPAMLLIS